MALNAQVASDALRYSYIPQYGGTARALGVGGTMGSIGGDFSTLTTNPAGLATYRIGELIITPGYHAANTSSTLEGADIGPVNQSFGKARIDNIGLVFAREPYGNNKWQTKNFAIGYNRIQDFGSNVFYEGTTKGSITARFRDQANLAPLGADLDPFESALADSVGAIYTKLVNNKRVYTTDFDQNPDAGVYRSQTIETRGGLGEMVIAYAANYNDFLQIGASLGVPFLNFSEKKIYREEDVRNEVPLFEKLQYNQNLTTTAAGLNAKLGLIVRPTKFSRLGFAFHTPTIYNIGDAFDSKLFYVYTENGVRNSFEQASPDGNFDYTLRTPLRVVASGGYIFGKRGFINADVEWADYSKANFTLDGEFVTAQNDVNRTIKARYKTAMNIRIGGEYVYEVFRFRAGIGLNGSPRQDKDFYNTTYNAGIGLRGKHVFLDLGWQRRVLKENYVPYKVLETQSYKEQQVTNSYAFTDLLLTFGVKF
jgi:hypothetical protein